MNFRLTLQYDGTDFHGWQSQRNREDSSRPANATRTVQSELERALSMLECRQVCVHGAGRTDAGVHAEAQVANVHLTRELTPERLRRAMNGNLPSDLRVTNVQVAPDDFHARFSARGKTYVYRIFNCAYQSPFWSRYSLNEWRALDLSAMQHAAAQFVGTHDWTVFSSAQTQVRDFTRTVIGCMVSERESRRGRGRMIEFTVSADGFLRYMVRLMTGTLLAVGRGERDADSITEILETQDRRSVGMRAAAHGLTLVKVHYDDETEFNQ